MSSLVLSALDESHARIELSPETILLASNETFCRAVAYDKSAITGRRVSRANLALAADVMEDS
jgi:hypothetical protein